MIGGEPPMSFLSDKGGIEAGAIRDSVGKLGDKRLQIALILFHLSARDGGPQSPLERCGLFGGHPVEVHQLAGAGVEVAGLKEP